MNETTGWYEMFFRGYDAALGRMLQVDPKAAMFAGYSTYNYAGNNPVGFNDPLGDELQINNNGEWEFTFAAEPSDHKTTLGLGGIGSRMVPTSFYGQRYTYAGVSIGRNSGMPPDMGMINEMAADIAAGHDVDVAALQQIGLTYADEGMVERDGNIYWKCVACGDDAGLSADGIQQYYNTYTKIGAAQERDPRPGDDLIRQYLQNEILGWGLIFAGDVLIENGVGGDYISELRNSLAEAPTFRNDKHFQKSNDVINMTVELVKQVKSWAPANMLADPYFTFAGGILGIKGEALIFENQNSLAPKILEVNPQWYNDNIAPIFSPQQFGGGGAKGGW